MRILYIARKNENMHNGASQVMLRNRNALKQIVGEDNIKEFWLPPVSIKNTVNSLIRMGSYGITRKNENEIIELARKNHYDYIFIEGTSYGTLYKKLKNNNTICFAHNCDTALAFMEITSRNPLISIPKYVSISHNEKLAVNYATHIICLTERDSNQFRMHFNRAADIILPITFKESKINKINDSFHHTPYLLFVGSNFFPNIEGITWFIKEVAPFINQEVHVVGSCCSSISLKSLKIPSNVKMLGYVDDLSQEYMNASAVIAPIYRGSGMKTKTIEALSYGKYIYGTSEAFEGIDVDFNMIGGLCNTANDFITALNNNKMSKLNEYSLSIFRQKYSDRSFVERLNQFLSK